MVGAKKMKQRKKNVALNDISFDIVSTILGIIILVVIAYPIYFVIIASISEPAAVYQGKTIIIPRQISFSGYEKILADGAIWKGYYNSFKYLIIGTIISLFITIPAGYALSKKRMKGRGALIFIFVLTMFFQGGLIPTYLLVSGLGMTNTIWAMVLPNALAVWNLMVTRTYYQSTISDQLEEAASIDGCTSIGFFVRIALPISKTIIMVIMLYYGVAIWNSYFDALLYLRKPQLYPLQIILRNILIQNQTAMLTSSVEEIDSVVELQRVLDQMKYGLIIISSLPLIILYPFIQKYFEKGVMIGSVKG